MNFVIVLSPPVYSGHSEWVTLKLDREANSFTDYSYLGLFVRWTFRTMDYSYYGLFVSFTNITYATKANVFSLCLSICLTVNTVYVLK